MLSFYFSLPCPA